LWISASIDLEEVWSMGHINAGDTAWMLVSTALVFFMMPGLALFYGGLVGAKNVIATMAQSFVAIGLLSVAWFAVGYSLVFGPDHGGLIGGLNNAFLHNVGAAPSVWAPTIPALVFMAFQMKFAVITPALIAGAVAERMKFSGYLLFVTLWSLLIYCPLAHWVWGGGWLGTGGVHAIDFAGGSVVHASAGAAALAAAIYVGRRRAQASDAHNIPLVLLGAGILWFGWFGFNAGSALSANGVAAYALVNTQLGASVGMLAWMAAEWAHKRRPSGAGLAAGAVAGLAAITPAAGYVEPWAAVLIGLAAGLACYYAVHLKSRFKYDDSLDVVGVHMVGGVLGVLLTGVFATLLVNAAGAQGGWTQLGRQALLDVVAVAFPFLGTLVLLKVIDWLVGVRVSESEEADGLDLSQHGEIAYPDLVGHDQAGARS
jgi:ammonium transporter, Amt family